MLPNFEQLLTGTSFVQHSISTAQHSTAQHSTAQRSTAQRSTAQKQTVSVQLVTAHGIVSWQCCTHVNHCRTVLWQIVHALTEGFMFLIFAHQHIKALTQASSNWRSLCSYLKAMQKQKTWLHLVASVSREAKYHTKLPSAQGSVLFGCFALVLCFQGIGLRHSSPIGHSYLLADSKSSSSSSTLSMCWQRLGTYRSNT